MVLKTHHWGPGGGENVVCLHGLTQHGGVFREMGEDLVADGYAVTAVDLRGHGESGREPPWNIDTHVQDLIETLDAQGIEKATLVAHSFGGRIAAAAAATIPDRLVRLALLDPGLEIPAERALRAAEIDRLDWSFATVDGAVNALMGNGSMIAPPRATVEAFTQADVKKGPDGRFRFSYCPSTAVVGWSEMTLPAPPIARVPTLAVLPETPIVEPEAQLRRYEAELGDMLTLVTVPNGHNVLWESPRQTLEAVRGFLSAT